MSLNRNRQVRPLEEELKEIGLDPGKTIGQIVRTSALIDKRMDGGNGGGAPDYTKRPQQKTLQEVDERDGSNSGVSGDDNLDEALRIIKKKRMSAADRLAAKRARKKKKSQLKRAAKMYYKKAKRKILKRAAKKLAKFGKAGLEKLHKMGRRIVMSDDKLSNLREDLNSGGVSEEGNSFEEAAFTAGMLTMYLGEIFEAYGDMESAETMYDVSDAAAELSESWASLGEDDEVEEEGQERLERVLDHTVKALKIYEEMGTPSLLDVIEATEDVEDQTDSKAA